MIPTVAQFDSTDMSSCLRSDRSLPASTTSSCHGQVVLQKPITTRRLKDFLHTGGREKVILVHFLQLFEHFHLPKTTQRGFHIQFPRISGGSLVLPFPYVCAVLAFFLLTRSIIRTFRNELPSCTPPQRVLVSLSLHGSKNPHHGPAERNWQILQDGYDDIDPQPRLTPPF